MADSQSQIIIRCNGCHTANRDPGPSYHNFTCGKCGLSLANSPRILLGVDPFVTLFTGVFTSLIMGAACNAPFLLVIGLALAVLFTLLTSKWHPDRVLQVNAFDIKN